MYQFTFNAHLRPVSRCRQVRTLPLIPTPNESFDTSYSSVTALRCVGNGKRRCFSEIFEGLREIF